VVAAVLVGSPNSECCSEHAGSSEVPVGGRIVCSALTNNSDYMLLTGVFLGVGSKCHNIRLLCIKSVDICNELLLKGIYARN
jgi:hypothetical protein